MRVQESLIKLRHIFFPWLLLSLALILGYSAFRWLFEQQLGLLPLQDTALNVLLPIVLVVAGVYLFVVPRLSLLELNVREPWVIRNNWRGFYFFAICFATGVPFVLCQMWFSEAVYGLVHVGDAADVRLYPGEKYFAIDEYQFEKHANRKLLTTYVSGGRYREWFVEYCIVSPFSRADSIWFGLHYKQSTRYGADADFKANIRNQLVENAQREFDTIQAADIRYFERLFNSEIREEMFNTVRSGQPSIKLENQIFLLPHRSEFEARLGNSNLYMWFSWIVGIIGVWMLCAFPKLRDSETIAQSFLRKDILEQLELALSFVFLHKKLRATAVLALLHIVVFVGLSIAGISQAMPTQSDLLAFGGNFTPAIHYGQFWRLATSVFVHGGLLHFCLNLSTLIVIGGFLERILGAGRLLIIYFSGGLAAVVAAFYTVENTATVGAPGAMFALIGAASVLAAWRILREQVAEFALLASAIFGLTGFAFCLGIDAINFFTLVCGLLVGALVASVFAIVDRRVLKRRSARIL